MTIKTRARIGDGIINTRWIKRIKIDVGRQVYVQCGVVDLGRRIIDRINLTVASGAVVASALYVPGMAAFPDSV